MKIDEQILAILQRLEITGSKVKITERLDRPTYQAVDKVLQALGGKWKRGDQAHVFAGSPIDAIDLAVATGDVITPRDEGFFETPGKLATELVRMASVRRGDVMLEPSAGLGALVFAALEAGANVIAIERNEARRTKLSHLLGLFTARPMLGDHAAPQGTQAMVLPVDDYMKFLGEACIPYNRVAMNPPFCRVGDGNHLDHVRKAYDGLDGSWDPSGGVLAAILPSGVMERQDARHKDFRSWANRHGGEFAALPPKSFHESGTDVNTVTLRMTKRG